MNIISKYANNVRMEEGKIIYEVSGYLESVKGYVQDSCITFDTGESYLIDLWMMSSYIDGIGMEITIQVSIDPSGKIEVEYLGEDEEM